MARNESPSDDQPPIARVAVVLNPRSGARAAQACHDELTAAFGRHGVRVAFVDVADPAALRDALRATGAARCDAVVAAGGDGTINAVANALAGDARPMGVIPMGTFNYVARRWGLPDDLQAAVDVVAAGRTMRIGAGQVADRLFLNNCSLGLYTSLIEARERHEGMFGRTRIGAVLSALVTLLSRHARRRVRIEHAGGQRRVRASMVFVGANPLQLDGIDPGVAQAVGRGALAVVTVRAIDMRRLIGFAVRRALGGAMLDAPEVQADVVQSAALWLHHSRVRVVIDGEVLALKVPLALRWRPDALGLRVPAQRTDPGDASAAP